MNDQQAREDIQIIRTMLEKTKKTTAESGTIFIVWGILITLALIGNYVLAFLKKYEWEWINWVVFTAIGWIYSALYGMRKERREPVRTYAQTTARHLYIACGVGFLLVALVLPRLGIYSYEAITVLVAAVTGILFFVMGGIFEWTLLKALGAFWWAGAVVISFFEGLDRTLAYTLFFVAGYLIPSFVFRAKYRREKARA